MQIGYQSSSTVPVYDIVSGGDNVPLRLLLTFAPGVDVEHVANISLSSGLVVNATIIGAHAGSIFETAVIEASVFGSFVSRMSLVKNSLLKVSFDVHASGPCLPAGYRARASFEWTLAPVPAPSALQQATTAVFRSSTVASGMLGNPVTAMTLTGMISLMSLDECLFSDVDQPDQSVSPAGVAVGPELGQYYRGAAIFALGLYAGIVVLAGMAVAVMMRVVPLRNDSALKRLAVLRLPSNGMIVVGIFHQGLATVGVSLVRLGSSAGDVALGLAAVAVCAGLVAGALYVTTKGFDCRSVERRENDGGSRKGLAGHRRVRWFLGYAEWKWHWEDTSATHFKKRFMMLMDDLQRPWWSAVELSAGLIQGGVLGIRMNSLAICRAQQWVLLLHCGGMLAAACYFRPCGAILSNVFLVASKAASFLIALCMLLHALTFNDNLASAANTITVVATIVSSVQTVVQLLALIFTLAPSFAQLSLSSIRRMISRWARLQSSSRQFRGLVVPKPIDIPRHADEVTRNEQFFQDETMTQRQAFLLTSPHQTLASVQQQNVSLSLLIAAAQPQCPRSTRLALLVEAACLASPRRRSSGSYLLL